jgi:hypothetical protein
VEEWRLNHDSHSLLTVFICVTGRNLRIREDTAKYLLNLDTNSAYYDPKTRSMREDPLPDSDPNEKFYEVCNTVLWNTCM